MTVREYNKEFYPKYQKAVSFISCLNHTLNKCDPDTKRQLSIIGWDKDTEKMIQDALELLNKETRHDIHFYAVDEETAELIEAARAHCIRLCSGGVQCLTCNQNKVDDEMEFVECLD